jgi:hypothetical protein
VGPHGEVIACSLCRLWRSVGRVLSSGAQGKGEKRILSGDILSLRQWCTLRLFGAAYKPCAPERQGQLHSMQDSCPIGCLERRASFTCRLVIDPSRLSTTKRARGYENRSLCSSGHQGSVPLPPRRARSGDLRLLLRPRWVGSARMTATPLIDCNREWHTLCGMTQMTVTPLIGTDR